MHPLTPILLGLTPATVGLVLILLLWHNPPDW